MGDDQGKGAKTIKTTTKLEQKPPVVAFIDLLDTTARVAL
jgi:hypothetical protein